MSTLRYLLDENVDAADQIQLLRPGHRVAARATRRAVERK
jgi:hypothetical protein